MPTIVGILIFISSIYNIWEFYSKKIHIFIFQHFSFYELLKFQFNWVEHEKKFYNLEACLFMHRSRGGGAGGPDPLPGPPSPGKSQVAIGFLRNSGMDTPREAFGPDVNLSQTCSLFMDICMTSFTYHYDFIYTSSTPLLFQHPLTNKIIYFISRVGIPSENRIVIYRDFCIRIEIWITIYRKP